MITKKKKYAQLLMPYPLTRVEGVGGSGDRGSGAAPASRKQKKGFTSDIQIDCEDYGSGGSVRRRRSTSTERSMRYSSSFFEAHNSSKEFRRPRRSFGAVNFKRGFRTTTTATRQWRMTSAPSCTSERMG